MKELKRDPAYVLSNLVTTKSGKIVTKKDIKLQVPVHFEAKKLVDIGLRNYAIGYFVVIMDDKYSVMSMAAKVELSSKAMITKEKINNVEYYNFFFNAGSVFIETNKVFREATIMYNIVDELLMQGKIPWYYDYDDVGQLLCTAKEYASSNLMPIDEIGEIIASIITRDKKDRTVYYRLSEQKEKPDYVALTSVFYSATNTVNKLCGNHFSEGVVSALVNPTTEVENVEKILRA